MIRTVVLNQNEILVAAIEEPLFAAPTALLAECKRQYRKATNLSDIHFLTKMIDCFRNEHYTIDENESTIYVNI